MTAPITVFREAVKDRLEEVLRIPFVDGKLDGPQTNDIGCTYPLVEEEREGQLDLADSSVIVRIFKEHPGVERGADAKPLDPAVLETLAVEATRALDDIQALPGGGAGGWYFRVGKAEYDLDDQGVQLTLRRVDANPFVGTS